MSSSDAENEGQRRPAKKQRVPKLVACDRCRKRKIQCTGRSGREKCRYCIQNGWQCEYLHAKRKYQVGYVKALEEKVEQLLRILKQLHPNEDFGDAIENPLTEETWPQETYTNDTEEASHTTLDEPSAFVSIAPDSTPTVDLEKLDVKIETDSDGEDEESSKLRDLTDGFRRMEIVSFYGRHSEVNLVRRALGVTYKLTGARVAMDDLATFGRPEYWQHRPWEALPKRVLFDFPPLDLLRNLTTLYFEHQNLYLPVLHRPTFMRLLSQGRHTSCQSFGLLVLAVCAHGSRFSDDPRIFMPGADSLTAGWYWFSQLWTHFPINGGSSRLYDLQCICLCAIYLMGCSAVQASWIWCGHGIRLAQDVGAHRRRVYEVSPTADDEQYRRVFWILILIEKYLGISMARPNAVRDQDFDLDLPNACDDIYWDHSDTTSAFKQPEGQPSRVDILVYHVKLYLAVAPAMHLIFASSKTRAMIGTTEGWERATLANLYSCLNMWSESVPTYLHWDPDNEDDVYLLQSAHLWTRFHELQINLHRPFIPSHSDTPNGMLDEIAFPSLSICLTASRAIVRIVECVHRRFPIRLFPCLHTSAFLAGTMLFLGIWGSSKYGSASRPEEDLQGIRTCERFIETLETRFHSAGRQRDVLLTLLSLAEKPPITATRGQKRTLEEAQTIDPTMAGVASSGATLAQLDEWLSWAQYEPVQLLNPSSEPPLELATNSSNVRDEIPVSSSGDSQTTADSLFTALGYHAPDDEYSLPLGDWTHSGGQASEGPDNFEQLFRSVLGSTS